MRFFKNLLVFLVGVFAVLVFLEFLLRMFWNPPFLDKRYARNDLDWISNNVVLNRFGYRDRDFSFIKDKDVFRIYTLGDSYTYGWMLKDTGDSYPKVIEKLLVQKYGEGKMEVINASKPGFTFWEEVNRLKQEGILFSPDLVIIGVNLFDFTTKYYSYHPSSGFPENLKLYQLTVGNFRRMRESKKMEREINSTYSDSSVQMEKARKEIQDLKKILDSVGSQLVIVVFPYFNPAIPNAGIKYPIFEKALGKLGEEENIKVIFLSNYFGGIKDKTTLVLNPIDTHPTILANSLAAEGIVKELEENISFKSKTFLKTKVIRVNLGSYLQNLKSILSIAGNSWVYFDRSYGDSTQRLFLPNTDSRKVPYMEDVLKTARLGRHEGWPGAKIEYNIPINGLKELSLPDKIYGYGVVGVSEFTVFWREEGALFSTDLNFGEVDITKEENKLIFKINRQFEYLLDLARILFDVAVNQFDMDDGKIVSLGKTEVLKQLETDMSILSLPRFMVTGKGNGYVWCGNKLSLTKIVYSGNKLQLDPGFCPQESKIEIPVMVDNPFSGSVMPLVEYLY